jgi:hypothetical protein
VTEFYYFVVSKPVPVNVTVAPPANDIYGVLDVGALAETTKSYLVESLIHAYLVSTSKYIVYAPTGNLVNVAVTDVSVEAETVPVIL